jgi:hypothetical protein
LHPSDNVFRTRESPDFEEDFVEKDPTGRYIRVCMYASHNMIHSYSFFDTIIYFWLKLW